jgi:hypothetical protein
MNTDEAQIKKNRFEGESESRFSPGTQEGRKGRTDTSLGIPVFLPS